MIYSFDLNDPQKDRLLTLLRDAAIDCEVQQKDRVVVRVFGHGDETTEAMLKPFAPWRAAGASERAPVSADFAPGAPPVMIAGPCAIESEAQIEAVADFLKERDITYIRGGAFKSRTSPDSFQGLGEQGLRLIAAAARPRGLKVVTEVMDRTQIDLVCEHADVLQVGSRSMFNYTLLTALGSVDRPVLLKRGMAATVDEWLKAAEYVSRGGNDRIILCERGIRTFETRSRNMLDIAAIAEVRRLSGWPVIADPSHAAGRRELVTPLALAAVAAGADGLMVEVHPEPTVALSDEEQALDFADFDRLLAAVGGLRRSREQEA